jgi:lipoprotein-anchoring transpeptidase ErfK/SrfK
VPWSLYFNEGAAIHGAYWHDGFGYRRSHGCVNVAAADAMWMFEWAEEGTWVHVHSSDDYR